MAKKSAAKEARRNAAADKKGKLQMRDKNVRDESADLEAVLETCSKEQLIAFLCDASLADSDLYSRIRAAADEDVSHRKVNVQGLPWDVTDGSFRRFFSPFGPINACHVFIDKATRRCKGYGFVLFRSRSGAVKALKQPVKQIGDSMVHCQLASFEPTSSGAGDAGGDRAYPTGSKIYVKHVHADTNPEKLRVFFAKFGTIESGPTGFDLVTGKSMGSATIVYKTREAARKALQEPRKMFEGRQILCRWAKNSTELEKLKAKKLKVKKSKDLSSLATSGIVGSAPQSVMAAATGVQNLQLYGHNPAYATLLGHNPLPNPSMLGSSLDGGLAGYRENSSLLGAYGTQGTAGLQRMQYGYSSLSRLGGSYDRMSSYP